MSQNSGLFITFEGIEGVGKTTQVQLAADWLQQQGHDVLLTREPGGTITGQAIRNLLLDKARTDILPDTELLLMFADRSQHLQEMILPALEQGKTVICDRFTDATFAYQGYGRGLPLKRISELEAYVQQGLQPDLTILLDAPVTLGLERAGKRGPADRFEQEDKYFFESIREGYLQRASDHDMRFRVINANQTIEQVFGSIQSVLKDFLNV